MITPEQQETLNVLRAGYAGIIKENTLLGVPKPKKVEVGDESTQIHR